MITLPSFDKVWDYENGWYLTCQSNRVSQLLAHYWFYMMVRKVPGVYVECGVFKGVSFCRFAMLRELFGGSQSRKMVGFDTFTEFPEATYAKDKTAVNNSRFQKEAGVYSISCEQLLQVLQHKNCHCNVELIEGNINTTVPEYLEQHPELTIALLNLDVDHYEPTKTILEYLYPRVEKGGIVILDDYGWCPGETDAIDEYFQGKIRIRKLPFEERNPYIVKT
jgi:hypothetical protein